MKTQKVVENKINHKPNRKSKPTNIALKIIGSSHLRV